MADLTPPPAPSDLVASTVSLDRDRMVVAVNWTDNCIYEDEYATLFQFRNPDSSLIVTATIYASQYDLPPGSTGPRQANVLVTLASNAKVVTARTIRLVSLEEDPNIWNKVTVYSDHSPRAVLLANNPTRL